MKQIKITAAQRERLIDYENADDSPDMRIPIPADGHAFPSDFCYAEEEGYVIDESAYVFAERRKFKWEDDEINN
ncbi:hypothetical protein [Thaumasiovibrio subtropicus]|uniref:hypothetical protein n=1 Tax=Thaumasiovibrio subtropicus TaxID=1891207 RepID=UPI000B34CF7E|nr:hypothetical protein [Thaumasiovibrio subtropicus]